MAKKRTRTAKFEELLRLLHSQPAIDLRPTLQGYAYRFTIYLPMLSRGKPVFSDAHLEVLATLFYSRFGGFSANIVDGSPPWQGSWLPEGAREAIIDRHMLLVIYTAQDDAAKTFFRYLKSILELKEVAHQNVVVVELIPVWLMEGKLLPSGS